MTLFSRRSTMRALSKQHARKALWMIETDVPTPGPNDLLIRVKKSSICGTDVHIYKWDEWAQHDHSRADGGGPRIRGRGGGHGQRGSRVR